MRAQARPRTRGDLRFGTDRRQPVPRGIAGLQAAIALQADQLGEDDGAQRRGRHLVPAQAGGRGIGKQCRPGLDAGFKVAADGLFEGLFRSFSPLIDDSAQPGDLVFRAGGTGSLRVAFAGCLPSRLASSR